jgi:hypothetical protein
MELYKDPTFLKGLLEEMDDCLKQLQRWSVENSDIVTDQLALFSAQFDTIKINIDDYQKDVMAEAESYIESGAGE